MSLVDLKALAEWLGRILRGAVVVVAYYVCGCPTTVRTASCLDDGAPLLISHYLTHLAAMKDCSTLEAEHLMGTFNTMLVDDTELATTYAVTHGDYLAHRVELGQVFEIRRASIGDTFTHIKYPHALLGRTPTTGIGVNPIGDHTLEALCGCGLWDPECRSC